MLDASYYEKTDEIIACHTREERSLIPIIQDIQEEYRYLPPELLSYVAGKIGISEAKAFSVASFYENFSFEAKGKYVIKVCDVQIGDMMARLIAMNILTYQSGNIH